ncbi:MAG TPA: CARDB domain-containing protein, partial [Phycisphaeraceae bacterium]
YEQIIDIVRLDEIDAGADREDTVTVNLPPRAANDGTTARYLGVIADPDDLVAEDDETNNDTFAPTELILDNGFEDLIGVQFDIDEDELIAGQTFTVTYAVRNTAPDNNTMPFSVQFYLSKYKEEGGVLTDDINHSEDLLLGSQDFISGIQGDQTAQRTIALTLPDEDNPWWYQNRVTGSPNTIYHIGMIVDFVDELIEETAEFRVNNQNLWYNDLNPDLLTYDATPQFIWVIPDTLGDEITIDDNTLSPGSETRVRIDIVNESGIAADPFDVVFYISTDGVINAQEDVEVGRRRMKDGLDGFATQRISQLIKLPGKNNPFWQAVGAGTYYIGAITNPPLTTNPVTLEEDDGNYPDNAHRGVDEDIVAITVGNIPLAVDADLVGTHFNVRERQAKTNDQIEVRFKIENRGTDAADPSTVRFYASRDKRINGADTLLGSYSLGSLAAGATTNNLGAILALPSSTDPAWREEGRYYIGMIVDAGNDVGESNESNNRNQGVGKDMDTLRVTFDPIDDPAGSSRRTAYNLGVLGQTPKHVAEFVGLSDKSDFYQFSLNKRSKVDLRVKVQTGNADMLLARVGSTVPLARSQRKGDTNERITQTLDPGVYFVKVYLQGKTATNYTFVAQADPVGGSSPSGSGPSGLVDVGGDSRRQAYDLGQLNAAIKQIAGNVGGGDRSDFFRFQVDKSARVDLRVAVDSGNVGVWLLREGSTEVIARSNRAGDANERIVADLDPGIYYLKVFAVNDIPSTYRVRATADYSPLLASTGLFEPVLAAPILSNQLNWYADLLGVTKPYGLVYGGGSIAQASMSVPSFVADSSLTA